MFRRVHVERSRLFRLLGRRGLLLLMFGLLWVMFGVGILATPQPRFSGGGVSVPVLSLLDDRGIGWLWIVAGLMASVSGLTRTRRNGADVLGFNALIAAPAVWLFGYLWSFYAWVADGSGRPTAWVAAIVWVIVVAFILLVAGWPDPDDPAYQRPENDPDG